MTSFEDRRKNLFDQLEAAESQQSFVTKRKFSYPKFDENTDKNDSKRLKTKTTHLRGKESIFKRPEVPIAGCLRPRTIPDYRKNPSKWTHYSLEDVPEMTDRSNAEAAAICFAECRKDKKVPEVKADLDDKVVFKLPIKDSNNEIVKLSEDEPENFKSFKGSKIVLPQYFIGQKQQRKKTNKTSNMKPGQIQLKLSHLEEEEEGDED